jgi:hypothetical protein
MSDVEQITRLLHLYTHLLDRGDFDSVAKLFSQGRFATSQGDVASGYDEVRALYANVELIDGTPRTKHLVTNSVIDIALDGRTADASSYVTILQSLADGEPVRIILSGRYDDTFKRGEHGWHFVTRSVAFDLVGDTSRHLRRPFRQVRSNTG